MNWVEILNTFGIPIWATLIIFGIWLLVKYYFNIQAKRDEAKFMHELAIKEREFEIQFSKLHLDRAEVIKEIYSKLVNLSTKVDVFAEIKSSNDAEKTKINKQLTDVLDAKDEYEKLIVYNVILFEESVSKQMFKIKDILEEITLRFLSININANDVIDEISNGDSSIDMSSYKIMAEESEKELIEFQETYNIFKNYLESEFRKLMGVEKPTNKS